MDKYKVTIFAKCFTQQGNVLTSQRIQYLILLS